MLTYKDYLSAYRCIPELSLSQPEEAHFSLSGKRLTVNTAATEAQGSAAEISVYTTDDRKVASERFEGCRYQLDLGAPPSGVYAVQLNTGSGKTTGSALIRLQ